MANLDPARLSEIEKRLEECYSSSMAIFELWDARWGDFSHALKEFRRDTSKQRWDEEEEELIQDVLAVLGEWRTAQPPEKPPGGRPDPSRDWKHDWPVMRAFDNLMRYRKGREQP